MLDYTTLILRFENKGEKSGWTYIEVPTEITQQLMPGNRKPFRVKGFLDQLPFKGQALIPMGDGNFIMSLNANIRKGIQKKEGAVVYVRLEVDRDYKIVAPTELMDCLNDDHEALDFFNNLARSHRDYFIKWIESAKTYPTRERRIIHTVNAMSKKQDYATMIRSLKQQNI